MKNLTASVKINFTFESEKTYDNNCRFTFSGVDEINNSSFIIMCGDFYKGRIITQHINKDYNLFYEVLMAKVKKYYKVK